MALFKINYVLKEKRIRKHKVESENFSNSIFFKDMRKHKILKSLPILLDYSKFIVKLLLQIAADKSQFAAIDFRTSHKLLIIYNFIRKI